MLNLHLGPILTTARMLQDSPNPFPKSATTSSFGLSFGNLPMRERVYSLQIGYTTK